MLLTIGRPVRSVPLALLLAFAACGRASVPAATDEEPPVHATRVAIFLLADSARLEAMRAEHTEDDYYAIADDMMWYRDEAWSWLEERGIEVVPHEGRPPLRFRVHGVARTYDFTAAPTAEVVVLYESDREPLAVAPVDVATVAATYYDSP